MKATKNSTPRVLCPEGPHIAILVGIIDWGTQTDKFGDRRKVEFLFETPEELHVFNEERGEEPFLVDRKFALTIGKKSGLKACLEGLTGQKIEDDEIELEEYLGITGMINIVHNEDGEYTNMEITSYSPLSKSDSKRKFKPHNGTTFLDLENFDQEVYNSLPDWKQEKIATSPEYKEAVAALKPKGKAGKQLAAVEEEDDLPFEKPGKKAAGKAAPKVAAKADRLLDNKKKR